MISAANQKTKLNKFRVEFSDLLGRHLVAAEDIQPGDTIISELPIVKGPSIDSKPLNSVTYSEAFRVPTSVLVCVICFNSYSSSAGSSCTNCNWNLFCDSRCAASVTHKSECRSLKLIRGAVGEHSLTLKQLYNLISVTRCLILRSHNPQQWQLVCQLQSKVSRLVETGATAWLDAVFSKLDWSSLTEDAKSSDIESSETVSVVDAAQHCYGVMRMNAYSDLKRSVGFEGLYFLTSLLTHSCVMNTDRQFSSDGSMVVKAAVQIKKGEILITTYVPLLNNTLQRHQEMNSAWFFHCECSRCQDKEELGTHLSTVVATGEDPQAIVDRVSEALPRNFKDVKALEKWLDQFDNGQWLHTNHSLFTQVKLYLCLYYGRQPGGVESLSIETLQRRLEYCKQLRRIYDIIYPGIYQCKGELLFAMWETVREMRHRTSTCDEDEKAVALPAYRILSHSSPDSSYRRMWQVLADECGEFLSEV